MAVLSLLRPPEFGQPPLKRCLVGFTTLHTFKVLGKGLGNSSRVWSLHRQTQSYQTPGSRVFPVDKIHPQSLRAKFSLLKHFPALVSHLLPTPSHHPVPLFFITASLGLHLPSSCGRTNWGCESPMPDSQGSSVVKNRLLVLGSLLHGECDCHASLKMGFGYPKSMQKSPEQAD